MPQDSTTPALSRETTAMALSPTAASAPGKVLLAGGYLVLDRAYTGLVFGLDARIHVHIQPLPTTPGVTLSEIIVKSPQFKGALWEYSYRQTEDDGGISITQLRAAASQHISRNTFIETALSYALTYVSQSPQVRLEPASITILADNDYYSAPALPAEAGGASRRAGKFIDFGTTLSETHKTGLGSSAALVTAFTAAVLCHFLPQGNQFLANDDGKATLHNLAQAAHCAAQGKVGSGFDVASAVYGSCLYRRFSPWLLEHYGEPGSPGFGARLKSLVDNADPKRPWDTDIMKSKVAVPEGIRLVMLDVDCGSQTPGMVKQVLAWRKEKPEQAERIWRDLQKANEDFAAELVRLGKANSNDYNQLCERLLSIRNLIRVMSEASGVPIEPQTQTDLLDECSRLPGVIGGVVPGAGGYDAVALLVEDKQAVIDGLLEHLSQRHLRSSQHPKENVGKVAMLGVREEMSGVRIEDVTMYQDWL